MNKAVRSIALATLVGGSAASLILACSDDDKSTFDTTSKDSGTADAGPVFGNPDGEVILEDTGAPIECKPALPSSFVEEWKPAHTTAACDVAKIGQWFDACVPDPNQQACKDWVANASNTACGTCIAPADKSGPIRIENDGAFLTLNQPACIAIANDKSGADSCAAKYYISDDCAIQSCQACFGKGGNFDDFENCRFAAWNDGADGKPKGACGDIETTRANTCFGDDAVPPACKGTDQEDQDRNSPNADVARAALKAIYGRVIGTVCIP